eukprot:GHVQ01000194.1.p1 GENE.GHVQ01000194.1~~GHVQ01000194.1.p1  ORF type:complete len:1601 (-),score=147.34 GHVQ01000194.1:145-4494(-)
MHAVATRSPRPLSEHVSSSFDPRISIQLLHLFVTYGYHFRYFGAPLLLPGSDTVYTAVDNRRPHLPSPYQTEAVPSNAASSLSGASASPSIYSNPVTLYFLLLSYSLGRVPASLPSLDGFQSSGGNRPFFKPLAHCQYHSIISGNEILCLVECFWWLKYYRYHYHTLQLQHSILAVDSTSSAEEAGGTLPSNTTTAVRRHVSVPRTTADTSSHVALLQDQNYYRYLSPASLPSASCCLDPQREPRCPVCPPHLPTSLLSFPSPLRNSLSCPTPQSQTFLRTVGSLYPRFFPFLSDVLNEFTNYSLSTTLGAPLRRRVGAPDGEMWANSKCQSTGTAGSMETLSAGSKSKLLALLSDLGMSCDMVSNSVEKEVVTEAAGLSPEDLVLTLKACALAGNNDKLLYQRLAGSLEECVDQLSIPLMCIAMEAFAHVRMLPESLLNCFCECWLENYGKNIFTTEYPYHLDGFCHSELRQTGDVQQTTVAAHPHFEWQPGVVAGPRAVDSSFPAYSGLNPIISPSGLSANGIGTHRVSRIPVGKVPINIERRQRNQDYSNVIPDGFHQRNDGDSAEDETDGTEEKYGRARKHRHCAQRLQIASHNSKKRPDLLTSDSSGCARISGGPATEATSPRDDVSNRFAGKLAVSGIRAVSSMVGCFNRLSFWNEPFMDAVLQAIESDTRRARSEPHVHHSVRSACRPQHCDMDGEDETIISQITPFEVTQMLSRRVYGTGQGTADVTNWLRQTSRSVDNLTNTKSERTTAGVTQPGRLRPPTRYMSRATGRLPGDVAGAKGIPRYLTVLHGDDVVQFLYAGASCGLEAPLAFVWSLTQCLWLQTQQAKSNTSHLWGRMDGHAVTPQGVSLVADTWTEQCTLYLAKALGLTTAGVHPWLLPLSHMFTATTDLLPCFLPLSRKDPPHALELWRATQKCSQSLNYSQLSAPASPLIMMFHRLLSIPNGLPLSYFLSSSLLAIPMSTPSAPSLVDNLKLLNIPSIKSINPATLPAPSSSLRRMSPHILLATLLHAPPPALLLLKTQCDDISLTACEERFGQQSASHRLVKNRWLLEWSVSVLFVACIHVLHQTLVCCASDTTGVWRPAPMDFSPMDLRHALDPGSSSAIMKPSRNCANLSTLQTAMPSTMELSSTAPRISQQQPPLPPFNDQCAAGLAPGLLRDAGSWCSPNPSPSTTSPSSKHNSFSGTSVFADVSSVHIDRDRMYTNRTWNNRDANASNELLHADEFLLRRTSALKLSSHSLTALLVFAHLHSPRIVRNDMEPFSRPTSRSRKPKSTERCSQDVLVPSELDTGNGQMSTAETGSCGRLAAQEGRLLSSTPAEVRPAISTKGFVASHQSLRHPGSGKRDMFVQPVCSSGFHAQVENCLRGFADQLTDAIQGVSRLKYPSVYAASKPGLTKNTSPNRNTIYRRLTRIVSEVSVGPFFIDILLVTDSGTPDMPSSI